MWSRKGQQRRLGNTWGQQGIKVTRHCLQAPEYTRAWRKGSKAASYLDAPPGIQNPHLEARQDHRNEEAALHVPRVREEEEGSPKAGEGPGKWQEPQEPTR